MDLPLFDFIAFPKQPTEMMMIANKIMWPNSIFLLMLTIQLTTALSLSISLPPLCHNDERLALMQFKQSFVSNQHKCSGDDPSAYPKLDHWIEAEGVDCCSWDGVECDQNTGYVIGLDLGGSCLYGSINSSNALFRLRQLQTLNLAFNHFNFSLIPSAFGNLSMLTYLDLSHSVFYGQIPFEISELFRLTFLDLSFNNLQLKKPDIKSLVQNLTSLSYLDLSYVDAGSPIPPVLANFSSLSFLRLRYCGLWGEFPTPIFHLPNIEHIRLAYNADLTGYLPQFNFSGKLKTIALINTSFYGELPASVGELVQLERLNVGVCNFTGLVPSTLGNLSKLSSLILGKNHFIGSIPFELSNLTQMTHLDIQNNMLGGSFPNWVSKFMKLDYFDCDDNQFSGTVELDAFLQLKELKYLFISLQNLSLITGNNINTSDLPQLIDLSLTYGHLRRFPSFLRSQRRLQLLNLASNNIQGRIPKWMSEVSVDTLLFLDLSNNSLTGFEDGFPLLLPWRKLDFLKLDSNNLQGSVSVPPFSTTFYSVKNNSLTGEIPQLLCNQTNLSILDFSLNNLSGKIPQCLSNFSPSLLVLMLRGNNFHGPIPNNWASGNRLKMIDFGNNKLQGKIPRSLKECTTLEYLDLGNNQIMDVFPSWLGVLKQLQVLLLCSNVLYGKIGDPKQSDFVFPRLRIMDLSHNRFKGTLPSGYFQKLNAMRSLDEKIKKPSVGSTYMAENIEININILHLKRFYAYSMTITNKGVQMEYPKIIRTLVAIDLSCNKFGGEIPNSIENLKELHLLNLSNNNLVGRISLAIAKLTNLEALDLSQNKLTGRIPLQLTQLTFLAIFNVSHNNLTGPIPQGQQFETFGISSFDENIGLCGKPLVRECENWGHPSTPPSSSFEETGLLGELHWKVVLLGYGCGFVFGIGIGHLVIKRKYDWFVKTSKSLKIWHFNRFKR